MSKSPALCAARVSGHLVAGVGHSVVSMVHGHNHSSKHRRIAELWEEISRDVASMYMCLMCKLVCMCVIWCICFIKLWTKILLFA